MWGVWWLVTVEEGYITLRPALHSTYLRTLSPGCWLLLAAPACVRVLAWGKAAASSSAAAASRSLASAYLRLRGLRSNLS